MPGKTQGTAILTCRNHPTYRWTRTKYSLPGTERTFIGRGSLMFDGEEGGKPECAFNMSEATLSEQPAEYQEAYRQRWTPECDCPASDLVFLAWADDDMPSEQDMREITDRWKNDVAVLEEFS